MNELFTPLKNESTGELKERSLLNAARLEQDPFLPKEMYEKNM